MKRLLVISAWVAALLIAAFVAFRYGERAGGMRVAADLESAQAALSFNHFLRYRQIEADLAKGCVKEALVKTSVSKDQELRLLASFVNEHGNTWVNKYISDRDPDLLKQLRNFKSAYGDSWAEPECTK